MAEIIGKISSNYKFSASNNDYSFEKLKKLSPVMIKMPAFSNLRASLTVRSSAGGENFGRRVVVGGQQRGVHTEAAAASDVKICQLAEMNPDVQFLQVNYEEHKSMCYSLNIHVLPFFRFYRGAHGRLCSFSCTNATIKKFKDALAKHTPNRCSLGPPKGLEEKELLALASNRDLSFTYTPNPNQPQKIAPAPAPVSRSFSVSEPSLPLPRLLKQVSEAEEDKGRTLVSSGQ